MCGIAGIIGGMANEQLLHTMLDRQRHRGPDFTGTYTDADFCSLGHNRLSIIDLSSEGNQPMTDPSGRYSIVFNGEIYNYKELRSELHDYFVFRTSSDTEVLLASYIHWGDNCLSRLIGMFSFAIWDNKNKTMFAARDRFGVKPFFYAFIRDVFYFASEIKTLWTAGVPKKPNAVVWANYFAFGSYGTSCNSFWEGINQLPGGHYLTYSEAHGITINKWYSFEVEISKQTVLEEEDLVCLYGDLLKNATSLRFRSDVPVGFNVSGGLDSSILLSLVNQVGGSPEKVEAFSFSTGNSDYDEIPWVEQLLKGTGHPLNECRLNVRQVPELAQAVANAQDEPYGGIPTIAYSQIFNKARNSGVTVLLDGQGMDEAWAGYDYYVQQTDSIVQGISSSPVRPDCLDSEFIKFSEKPQYPTLFSGRIQNLQYRDIFYTKIPRALRFNDRISMMYSTELREPFLDHRLVEFAFALPDNLKIGDGKTKWLLRNIASKFIDQELSLAPKRPIQTPQREWLAGELKDWAHELVVKFANSEWANKRAVLKQWHHYTNNRGDNSFYIWQWINHCLLA